MHEAGSQKIFSEATLSAIAVHNVSIGTIYFDTTTMSVEGEYNGEEEDEVYGLSRLLRLAGVSKIAYTKPGWST
jgi:hypothetical protein